MFVGEYALQLVGKVEKPGRLKNVRGVYTSFGYLGYIQNDTEVTGIEVRTLPFSDQTIQH